KTKDGVNVRNDMEDMGIRPQLAAKVIPGKRGMNLLPAFYTMSKIEKTKFCQCLHGIKVPSGYSANIKKLVSMKDLKLSGMKSDDCHMYFQPSFFNVMVHLVSHIVREIKTTGPLFLWSMYPFERYMGYLKGYAQKDDAQEAKEVLENRLIDVGDNIGARWPLLNAAYLRWMSHDDSTLGYGCHVSAGMFVGSKRNPFYY
ncbi:hypothetical protein Tco_1427134, partial [Tanacetum coccineum]